MYILAKTKFGDCDICPKKNTQIIKVGKTCYCLSKCYRELKTGQQITKANQRDKQRYEASKNQNHKPTPSLKSSVRGLVDKNKTKELNELDKWFKDRRKEMTGVCANCGGKSSKEDDKKYKFSLAHILPKAIFKSVATHPDNWLELCFYGNSCHTNLDNNMIDLIDLNCFDTVIEKFVKIYPHIVKDELRRVPPILIEYLKNEI